MLVLLFVPSSYTPFSSSFAPLDPPFLNTPFLDFKTIFHPSCCDGKCDMIVSANKISERKKQERKGRLTDLFHCMATCLKDLEHSNLYLACFFFFLLLYLILDHQLVVDLKD